MPRVGGIALAAALLGGPADAAAQVFIDASSRPDFTIARCSSRPPRPPTPARPWRQHHVEPRPRHGERPTQRTLALFWPAEIAGATAPAPPIPPS